MSSIGILLTSILFSLANLQIHSANLPRELEASSTSSQSLSISSLNVSSHASSEDLLFSLANLQIHLANHPRELKSSSTPSQSLSIFSPNVSSNVSSEDLAANQEVGADGSLVSLSSSLSSTLILDLII